MCNTLILEYLPTILVKLTLSCVRTECKSKRIRSTFRNPVRIILFLTLPSLLNLARIEIPAFETLVEAFKGNTMDHVERIDDVSERFAHFPAVGVANHGVKIHLQKISINPTTEIPLFSLLEQLLRTFSSEFSSSFKTSH
jgi:hypothetical protein